MPPDMSAWVRARHENQPHASGFLPTKWQGGAVRSQVCSTSCGKSAFMCESELLSSPRRASGECFHTPSIDGVTWPGIPGLALCKLPDFLLLDG